MDPKNQKPEEPLNPEEFYTTIIEFYESFGVLLREGDEAQKAFAITSFQWVQEMISERLDDHAIVEREELKKLQQVIEHAPERLPEWVKEARKKIIELKESTKPLVEKEMQKGKKSRPKRSKMERNLRSKD